jgi:hypothetical protein
MSDSPFASPIGLSRDPHWDDAWTDKRTNQYVLPHPDNEFERLRAGRASELGKTISNTFTLNRWHKEMVLRGVMIRRSILLRAANALNGSGLSAKGLKRALWDLCQEAEDTAGAKEPAALGTGFHEMTERWDAGTISLDAAPEPSDRDLLAYAEIIERSGLISRPEFTEQIIWNRPVNIAGRFDRLWPYKHCDRLHVGDLKTGRYIEYGWGENPIQLWCYANGTHMFDARGTRTWGPMPEMCTELGLILHIPSDGKKYLEDEVMANGELAEGGEPTGSRMAALYEVKLDTTIPVAGLLPPWLGADGGSTGFLSPAELAIAVQQWHKASKKVSRMVCRVEVTPHGEVIDSPLTVRERIEMADTEMELADLRRIHLARKEWSGWHTRWARERLETLAS